MRIFLIRHGESLKNAGLAREGIPDQNIDLTEKGIMQAENCGKLIFRYCNENNIELKSSIIIKSPYRRTQITADIINRSLKITQKVSFLAIEYQKGVENGDLTIPTSSLLKRIYNETCASEYHVNESPIEIVLRAKELISALKKLDYENVFIVSHYGFIRALDIALLNKPLNSYFNGPKIKNCSVRLYMLKDDKCTFINHIEDVSTIEK